jgi:2-oxoisovalerate dehydrogenase E2 component (dihydrolipoyl transacylase)
MTREHDVEITEITGTGKDGRVLKEDVTRFVEARKSGELSQLSSQLSAPRPPLARAVTLGVETKVPLTHIQSQMLRSMTKSLTIPHFLYSDEINFDPLIRLRSIINKPLDANPPVPRVSFTPFVVKAVSIALDQYPLLNSRLEFDGDNKPYLIMRPQHNIGVAMDTPVGLVVPNIKDVNSLSILDIAAELKRLQELGGEDKLTPADLSGGTITVSNIGNIGGTVVAPVIVAGEVAILGMGRARKLPRFNENGGVVAETVANFSWSADHRVVDGATMARMAALVRELLEVPAKMFARMR